jgi:hypothetical protein
MRHAGVIGTDLTAHVSFLIGFVRFRHLTTYDAESYRPENVAINYFLVRKNVEKVNRIEAEFFNSSAEL